MPSRVVADASVLLASVLNEDYTPNARTLLSRWTNLKTEICAPILFQYEVVATLRRRVYTNELTMGEARNRAELLLGQGIQYYHDHALLIRGFELASQFNRPRAYDSQYLALAERLGCEFWTADERLVNSVKNELAWVHWLGEIRP